MAKSKQTDTVYLKQCPTRNSVLTLEADTEPNESTLIYGLTESPPVQVTILCGIQQVLISLTSSLVVSSMVAQVVCASNDDVFRARLLSSTLFMNGVTTIAMNVLGVRLPMYQGATAEYILPLLILGVSDSMFCSSKNQLHGGDTESVTLATNTTSNTTSITPVDQMNKILENVRSLQGSLMAAGVFHAMFGFTGLIGKMLRFTGPLTIVPSMVLIAVFAIWVVIDLVKGHWAIGISTAATGVILSQYLVNYKMPIPVWTPAAGFRITRYPLHQVFSLLIAILINWAICGVLTATGSLTTDSNDIGYKTRTDGLAHVFRESPWIMFPYPGQYGMIGFSWSACVCYIIAALTSIIDSVGDYFACARTCEVPPPPKHAVNRGLLIEGACCFLSGAVGCGHGTTTYGDNVGAIGFTKVASRRVFVCTGLLYIFLGLIGKLSAVFISIPDPVIGGAAIIMYSTFLGVAISNLHSVKLTSSRNMSIFGLGVILGLMIPTYINSIENPFQTGSETLDMLLNMVLGNVAFCGPVIAFVLDNTIPGNIVDRGIAAWIGTDTIQSDRHREKMEHIYFPLLPKKVLQLHFVKYIPFLPYIHRTEDTNERIDIKL